MDVGEFDGVADLLNLFSQPADLFVADVRNLFENQLFDFGPGETLENHPGASVHPQMVTDAYQGVLKAVGDGDDQLVVGPGEDQQTPIGQLVTNPDNLTPDRVCAHIDNGEGLVEKDFLAFGQLLDLDVGLGTDPQLAGAGHDIDTAVFVDLEDGAEVVGRGRQLLNLGPQDCQLLASLFENGAEAIVLNPRPLELGAGVYQPLLEVGGAARCFVEPAAQRVDLDFETGDLAAQRSGVVSSVRAIRHTVWLLLAWVPPAQYTNEIGFATGLFPTRSKRLLCLAGSLDAKEGQPLGRPSDRCRRRCQGSMKMHSPGHSSADSIVMSSWPAGTTATPAAPSGLPLDAA